MSRNLYQPLQRDEDGLVRASDLEGAVSYQINTLTPENPHAPTGEWRCANVDCVVRDVTVYCKLQGEKLPRMMCPGCRKPLRFRHWVVERILVPVKPQ